MVNTRYSNLKIDMNTLSANINRLTNQLWKLIPMREHEENWQGQLDNVILEIAGLKSLIMKEDIEFLVLLSKLEGLRVCETSFETYRTAVFKCISLLRELRL